VLELAKLFHLVEPCAQIEGIHGERMVPGRGFCAISHVDPLRRAVPETLISRAAVTSITGPARRRRHDVAMEPKPLRVVVADDDPDTVLSLRLLLEEDGHTVRGVGSGSEALSAVRDFGADVVLLDIGMPGMTGFAVAHTLRERYGSAKPLLIAITGRNAGSDRWLARSMGIDHYVAKPYDPSEVLALLSVRPALK